MWPSTYKRCKVASTAQKKEQRYAYKKVMHRRDHQKSVYRRSNTPYFYRLPMESGFNLPRYVPEENSNADAKDQHGWYCRLAGFAAPFSAMGANSVEIKLRDQSYPAESGESEVPPG
jgi:hypothetical protein